MDGDLKKQTWDFWVSTYFETVIYFERYASYEKPSNRHRNWNITAFWSRHSYEGHITIQVPPLPEDVESEVRAYFAEQIKALPIER